MAVPPRLFVSQSDVVSLPNMMNAHIAKPFQPEDLLAVLAGYINSLIYGPFMAR